MRQAAFAHQDDEIDVLTLTGLSIPVAGSLPLDMRTAQWHDTGDYEQTGRPYLAVRDTADSPPPFMCELPAPGWGFRSRGISN